MKCLKVIFRWENLKKNAGFIIMILFIIIFGASLVLYFLSAGFLKIRNYIGKSLDEKKIKKKIKRSFRPEENLVDEGKIDKINVQQKDEEKLSKKSYNKNPDNVVGVAVNNSYVNEIKKNNVGEINSQNNRIENEEDKKKGGTAKDENNPGKKDKPKTPQEIYTRNYDDNKSDLFSKGTYNKDNDVSKISNISQNFDQSIRSGEKDLKKEEDKRSKNNKNEGIKNDGNKKSKNSQNNGIENEEDKKSLDKKKGGTAKDENNPGKKDKPKTPQEMCTRNYDDNKSDLFSKGTYNKDNDVSKISNISQNFDQSLISGEKK